MCAKKKGGRKKTRTTKNYLKGIYEMIRRLKGGSKKTSKGSKGKKASKSKSKKSNKKKGASPKGSKIRRTVKAKRRLAKL